MTSPRDIPLQAFLRRLIWLCVLPLLLLAGWLAIDSLHEQRARQDREAERLTQNLMRAIDQQLGISISALNMLALSPLIDQRQHWSDLYREAMGFEHSFGSHVILTDTASPPQMLLNTRVPYGQPLPRLPRPRGHAAAPAALASGRPAVGDLVFGPTVRQPLLAIAVPVLRQAKPAFILLTTFETRQFQEQLDKLSLPANWVISLRDGNGEIIARRAPESFDPLRDVAPSGRFTVRSGVAPWSVVLEIPRRVRLSPLLATGLILALGLLSATLAGVFGGMSAARQLTRAVNSLSDNQPTDGQADISEINRVRQRLLGTREELLASEERFRRLFHEAPVPFCFLANSGAMLDRNARFVELFGYTGEDVPTIDAWWPLAYPDPDYRTEVQATWQAALARAARTGDDIEPIEYRITCKDGAVRDVIVSGIVMGDGFFATFFDISERKRAEERLRLWAESFEHAKLGLAISNARDNTFLAVNPAFAADRGYAPDELPGRPISTVFPPDLLARVGAEIARADTETHAVIETEHQCRDGRRFPVLLDITVLRDERGQPLNRVVYALDLSERKAAEQALADTQARALEQQKRARLATLNQMQDANAARARAEAALLALRESREQLQLFIEHAPASLAMFDRDMRYLAVSRRWLEDYGLERRDILGRSHYAVLPETPEDWKAIHRRGLNGEVVSADGERFVRADGRIQWVRWEVRPWLAADGPVGGIVIFSEDITRQKQAEEEIRQLNADLERRVVERTAELSAANRELESFAYAVSHDLRAPLRAMGGFSRALVEDCGEQLVGEARTYLDQIVIASQRMSELIDGILALSRSTRGELQRDRIDLSAMAERRLRTLAGEEPERRVDWQVAPDLGVHGDERMIEAVMVNLLDNAWKYTAKTDAPRIRVTAEEIAGASWICVADNGAGFDMAHAERLFKPFQRLHRQDEFPGIGIGLATVMRIIHRHGGEIVAHGEPGRGATFRFHLPPALMKES